MERRSRWVGCVRASVLGVCVSGSMGCVRAAASIFPPANWVLARTSLALTLSHRSHGLPDTLARN